MRRHCDIGGGTAKKHKLGGVDVVTAAKALDEHIRITEDGIRSLKGLSGKEIDRLVRFLDKSNRKLKRRIEGHPEPEPAASF